MVDGVQPKCPSHFSHIVLTFQQCSRVVYFCDYYKLKFKVSLTVLVRMAAYKA